MGKDVGISPPPAVEFEQPSQPSNIAIAAVLMQGSLSPISKALNGVVIITIIK